MKPVEALVLVLRLDTIVADWPRSADSPGRMSGDGVRPAEGMRWKRLGIRKVRKETPMRRIRGSVTVCCWLVVVGLAPMAAQAQSKGLPAPSALLAFRPTLPGVDYDMPADQKAIDACKVELVTVQNRSIGYCAAGRPGEDAPPVRRHPGRQDGPVELLPGRVRGLPRDRPGRRPGPGRGPVDERRRHAGRDGQEGEDRRLEADLGGGGLEGLRAGAGPGDERRRHVAAGGRHGDAR